MIAFNLALQFLHFDWDIWGSILYSERDKQKCLQSWTKYYRRIPETNRIGFYVKCFIFVFFCNFCGAIVKVLTSTSPLGTRL